MPTVCQLFLCDFAHEQLSKLRRKSSRFDHLLLRKVRLIRYEVCGQSLERCDLLSY